METEKATRARQRVLDHQSRMRETMKQARSAAGSRPQRAINYGRVNGDSMGAAVNRELQEAWRIYRQASQSDTEIEFLVPALLYIRAICRIRRAGRLGL